MATHRPADRLGACSVLSFFFFSSQTHRRPSTYDTEDHLRWKDETPGLYQFLSTRRPNISFLPLGSAHTLAVCASSSHLSVLLPLINHPLKNTAPDTVCLHNALAAVLLLVLLPPYLIASTYFKAFSFLCLNLYPPFILSSFFFYCSREGW